MGGGSSSGTPSKSSAEQSNDEGGTWEGAATVGTVVTEDGTPVPEALVVLGDLDSSDDTDMTGPDGRFAIDEFPSYSTLHAFQLREDGVWHGEEPADGGPFDWKVVLKPPASSRDRVVLVRVLGPDGQPIPKGRAVAISGKVREPWRFRWGQDAETAVTRGWFPVARSRWRKGEVPAFLVGSARDEDGRALPFGSALVRVDPEGPPVVDVRLPMGGVVSGRVVLPDESPAIRTLIYFDAPAPAGFDGNKMERPCRDWKYTDECGAFDFAGNAPGKGTLVVESDAGEHGGSGPVQVGVGGPEILVRLRSEIPLRVLVCDEAGTPVTGASVAIVGDSDRKALTDRDGTATLTGLPEGGDVSLVVDRSDYVRHQARVVVQEQVRRVILQRCGVIRGRVLGPDGGALEEVPIVVEPRGATEVSWWTTPAEPGMTFAVTNVPAGSQVDLSLSDGTRRFGTTRATADGSEYTLQWPAEEDRLTLLLGTDEVEEAAGAWRSGVVIRDAGKPLLSIPVPGPVVSIPARDLPPSVDIQVGPSEDGRWAYLPRVPSHGFVRLELRKTASFRGRVVLPGGEAAEFARCVATTEGGFVTSFETDVEGKFDAGGLPSGRVTLRATSSGGRTGTVTVDSPTEEEVLVTLREK